MLSDKVINFIQQYAQLIEKEKFDDLFWKCKREAFDEVDVFQLKNVLLASDIDPLEYLTVIPQYYFHNDSMIKSFTCKPQVTIIEASAFYGSSLKQIDLSNVFELGSCSFAGCERLSEIYLPDAVQKIFPCCFEGCTHLDHLSELKQQIKNCTIETFLKIIGVECNYKITQKVTCEEILQNRDDLLKSIESDILLTKEDQFQALINEQQMETDHNIGNTDTSNSKSVKPRIDIAELILKLFLGFLGVCGLFIFIMFIITCIQSC